MISRSDLAEISQRDLTLPGHIDTILLNSAPYTVGTFDILRLPPACQVKEAENPDCPTIRKCHVHCDGFWGSVSTWVASILARGYEECQFQ